MSGQNITTQTEEVRALIEQRLRLKAPTLDRALARAGRLLPKWAHRDARRLVEANVMMSHPKLRLAVDHKAIDKAHARLVEHLKTIDPAERRKTRILSILGSISFNLIAVATALILYLVWRGYV